MTKSEIRNEILLLRAHLDREFIIEYSNILWNKLYSLDVFKNAKVIMSFMSFKNEVNTEELNKNILKMGKKLVLPRVNGEDMEVIEYTGDFSISKFGIKEPIGKPYLENIDLIIVPGLAFDSNGNRIGYGKGYYDRFFKNYPDTIKIAPIYDFQLYDNIPHENFDIPIHALIIKDNLKKIQLCDKIL